MAVVSDARHDWATPPADSAPCDHCGERCDPTDPDAHSEQAHADRAEDRRPVSRTPRTIRSFPVRLRGSL